MPVGQEPPDGDFVAYLEMLQRESATRLNVAPVPIDTARAAAEARLAGHGAGHVPVLDRQQAAALLERVGKTGGSDTAPAIGLVVGLALLALGLLRNGGFVTVAIGLGFMLWSVSRLRAAHARRAQSPALRTQVGDVFGKRPGSP